MDKNQESKMMILAAERISFPNGYVSVDYQKNKSLLKVRLLERKIAYSKGDMKEGIVYDFDTFGELVAVELLDFFYVETIEEIKEADTLKIKQTAEAVRTRRAEKAARKKLKNSCKVCGKPKHNICFDHHSLPAKGLNKFYRKFRRLARRIFFDAARKIGFGSKTVSPLVIRK